MRMLSSLSTLALLLTALATSQAAAFAQTENQGPTLERIGCFKDAGDRDLGGHHETRADLTPRRCVEICKSKGFSYAGVQYGEHCFCGNAYGKHGTANNCDVACAGDGSKTCGGGWANEIYHTADLSGVLSVARNVEVAASVGADIVVGTDADGDGHDAIQHGGDDCDDDDPNRYPGNAEVVDTAGHDEDCDPTTFGIRDADGDGYPDDAACNTDSDGTAYCGTDCDDSEPSIHPSQIDVLNGRDDDCDGSVDEDQRPEDVKRLLGIE